MRVPTICIHAVRVVRIKRTTLTRAQRQPLVTALFAPESEPVCGAFPFSYWTVLLEPVKETLLADFTSTAFAEPLIVISETASPSMWLFEPLMTTVFVPAGISTCALDSLTVKAPEASDLPESFDVSDLPESVDESV